MRSLPAGVLFLLLSPPLACGDQLVGWPTPDDTAPSVSATTPVADATDVALNAPISATFSEAMDPATVSGATFSLSQGATSVPGTVIYVGVTALLAPTLSLDPNTSYTATITDGATDLAGNALVDGYAWSFTTGELMDTTAPRVSSTTPMDGATAVALNAQLTATFSEAMDPATISTSSFTVLDGTTPVPGSVSYVGVTATFDPTDDLDANTSYTATVGDAATDLAGNPLAADYVWTFTTGPVPDTQAPRVTFTVPADDATGVARGGNILATFSEAMDPTTISTVSFTLQQLDTNVAGTVTYTNVTATFNPTSALAANTTYSATITTAARDLAGNPLVRNFVWNFRTGATLDTTRPTVIATIPADGDTDVVRDTNVSATFSEAMAPLTLTTATFTLEDGTGLIDGAVTMIGATAVFNPTSVLDVDTEYMATVTSEATDLAGNALAADYVWSFTTGSQLDEVAPTVIFTTPEDLAVDVPLNATVNATFSEAMDPLTITTVTFVVTDPDTNEVTGTVLYDVLTRIATFRPEIDLLPDTEYTATVTIGATDVAGNALEEDYVWSFTTGTGLVLPPINLGTASPFGTFGGSAGMTNQGLLTVVNGDIGTTAASTLVTGFHDTSPGCIYTETTLNEGFVNGLIYTAPPPPTVECPSEGTAVTFDIATLARADALAAYNELVAQPAGSDPGAGSLSGLTLAPGVYTSASGSFMIQGSDLTLDGQGDPNAVWVFQMASTLTVGGPGASFPQSVTLIGGALAKNVFWQVGSAATINAAGGGTMVGTIICQEGAEFSTAGNTTIATLNGRVLSLGASVTVVNTVINVPAP